MCTKDEYASTLRAYQKASDELKSENRVKEERRIDGTREVAMDPKVIERLQQRANLVSGLIEHMKK